MESEFSDEGEGVLVEFGQRIAEGKTKVLFVDGNRSGALLIRWKPDITAFDDKRMTQSMDEKPELCTRMALAAAMILDAHGVPRPFMAASTKDQF